MLEIVPARRPPFPIPYEDISSDGGSFGGLPPLCSPKLVEEVLGRLPLV
jgi:hypothetical protein